MNRGARRKREGLGRIAEVSLAAFGLVASLPLIAMGAAAAWLNVPGPILFRQERMGRGGKKFVLLKLRTMRTESGPKITACGDARIFPVGCFLRRLKIDELPGLWNVLRGDMRLVGPRPEVPEHVDLGDPRWQRVLMDAPGLTDPVTQILRHEEVLLRSAGEEWQEFYKSTLQPLKLAGYIEYQRGRTWRSDVRVLAGSGAAILKFRRPSPSAAEMLNALALLSEEQKS
jgi:lipopolysaccharide/colanic/teichoic acid biosynthesis glycosyltransferase